MRRKEMTSWSLVCVVLGLLTASIHSTKPLSTADHKVTTEDEDLESSEVLRRAVQYIADQSASVPEDSGSNESLRDLLAHDSSESREDGKGVFPNLNLADDTVENSGNSGSLTDSTEVKRRWGDSRLQLWGKRNSEVTRAANGSVLDNQEFGQHSPGDDRGDLLEEDDLEVAKQQDSLHESSISSDSTGDAPCTLGGTRQTTNSKSNEASKRKWGDNSMTVWGKRKAYEKRKWGDNTMSAWGKREDGPLEQPIKRKWGDNSMTVWGKRISDLKRKWGDNSLTAWGKRDIDDKQKWDENSKSVWDKRLSDNKIKWRDTTMIPWEKRQVDDKRKWGDNSLAAWGKRESDDKRKWGDNSVSIWGKREVDDKSKWEDNSLTVLGKLGSDDKRKWADNSMSIWGKRQADDKRKWGDNSVGVWGKREADDKRKWGDNSVGVWGKRQAADKRKWGDNSMSAWGKREADDKRKWGDNSISVWGKRQAGNKRKWGDNSMSAWEKREADDKRKWGDNSVGVWGKRQAGNKRKWGDNSMSAWGKREADDKRKWGDNSLGVWGKRQSGDKRKWGDNSMSVWGKREDGQDEDQPSKRKWGDNSMTVWGRKRNSPAVGPTEDPTNHLWLQGSSEGHAFPSGLALTDNTHFVNDPIPDIHHDPKDTSGESGPTDDGLNSQAQDDRQRNPVMANDSSNRKSITKRSVPETPDMPSAWTNRLRKRGWSFWGAYVNPYEGPKRNWETNTMKVWGKRQDDEEKEADAYADWATTSAARDDGIWKRIWTSDNSIRIWGR